MNQKMMEMTLKNHQLRHCNSCTLYSFHQISDPQWGRKEWEKQSVSFFLDEFHAQTSDLQAFDEVKKLKSSNRGVVYRGDSRTSGWRNRKYWNVAAKDCQKVDSFFMASRRQKPKNFIQKRKLTHTQRKRPRTPSPDLYTMSEEGETMAEDLYETPAQAFANEMGLDFGNFCMD